MSRNLIISLVFIIRLQKYWKISVCAILTIDELLVDTGRTDGHGPRCWGLYCGREIMNRKTPRWNRICNRLTISMIAYHRQKVINDLAKGELSPPERWGITMRKLRHWPAAVPNRSAFRMPLWMVTPQNDHHSEGCAILNFCQNRPFDAFFWATGPDIRST